MKKYVAAVLFVALALAFALMSRTADALTVPLAGSSNDAYHAPTGWPGYSHTDSVVYAGKVGSNAMYGGYRFVVDIPAGATVTTAYVTLRQNGWGYQIPTILAFELNGAAPAFSSSNTPNTRWANRTSEVNWTWAKSVPDSAINTPTLVSQLQQVVDSGAVSSVVLLEAPAVSVASGQNHSWHAYDGNPLFAPVLTVEWTEGGTGTGPLPTPTPTATGTPAPTPTATPTSEPTATATPAPDCTSILFVGNSYTAYGSPNMRDALQALYAADGECMIYTYDHIGGANLGSHIESASPKIIAGLDYVILQGMLGMTETAAEYRIALDTFVPLIESVGAQPVIFSTWLWQTGALSPVSAAQEAADAAYAQIAADYGAILAPIGIAWQVDGNPALYDPDGSHPAQAGTDLGARVLHAVLD